MFISTLFFACAAVQEPTPLMEVGDPIANSAHSVARFDKLRINRHGDWLAQAQWDHGVNEFCLIRNGNLEAEYRALLSDGPGSNVRWKFTNGMGFNDAGDTFYSMLFTNNPSGLTDEGLYFGFSTLFTLEGDPVLAANVPAGSFWNDWDRLVLNNTGTVLVNADYEDGLTGTDQQVLVKLGLDPSGNPTGSEEIIVSRGEIVDGDPVIAMPAFAREMDMNDAGDVIANVRLDPIGPQESIVLVNQQVVARDGNASSVSGIAWDGLGSAQVAINEHGDYVFTAELNSTTVQEGVFVNGQPFALYGDQLASIAPFELRGMHGHPVDIAETGDILWWGEFNDTNSATNNALFLNDQVLVQAGVTSIGGATVDEFDTGEHGYYLSDSGRCVIFEAKLSDGREGLYKIDLMPGPVLQPIQPGVAGQPNTATVTNLASGQRVLLGASRLPGSQTINCGAGTIEIGLAAPALKIASITAGSNGEASYTGFVSANQAGMTWHMQALDLTNCLVSNVISVTF